MLSTGKLPPDLLARLLAALPAGDPRLVLGPGPGLDCAVIDMGETLLAAKSDPITFATEEIGWYAVQVNANDIATTGATPRWFLATVLLPEGQATADLAESIFDQIRTALAEMGAALVGGHTEVTFGLPRPIVAGTMLGEVTRERLVTPRGARPGDRLLLTQGVPIEATALLSRELAARLGEALTPQEIQQAGDFLHAPGISVVKAARIAGQAGKVTAMHDPTEGGLLGALWELAEACGFSLWLEPESVPIPTLARKVCSALGIDPLAAIASGALLLAAPAGEARRIRAALEDEAIPCAEIGAVEDGPPGVWGPGATGKLTLPRPERDEVARLFESG